MRFWKDREIGDDQLSTAFVDLEKFYNSVPRISLKVANKIDLIINLRLLKIANKKIIYIIKILYCRNI